ncbi:MAG: hypothetical protein ABGZ17_00025, partial [Planctomycetaceae bacterium]
WKWLHWTIPGLLGRPASDEESTSLHQVFDTLASLLDAAPHRLAHRDFKAENLHLVCEPAPNAPASAAPTEQIVMIGVKGAFLDSYVRIGSDNELAGCSTNEQARQQWAETMSQMIPRRRLAAEPSAVSLQGHVDPLPGGRRLKTALICTAVMGAVGLLLLWVRWVQR